MTVLVEVKNAQKHYGDQDLLVRADVVLTDQHKVGLIGRNGAGKSTLCRILLGEEELDAGEVSLHPRLRLGYLRQHDPFEPTESVMDFLIRDSGQADWRCGQVAAQFELKGAMLERPIGELSGGWQTRVKLAALLLHDPNLLVLDEPTNFLDLRTQLLLEEFLRQFRAAALIVSHDRAFLKATCDRTLELARGKLTMFSGNVDAFLEHKQQRREHDEKVNATTLAKRRQLERFIARNRANAGTASQARNKAKQLERLELIDVEGPEAEVRLRLPRVEPRRGPAVVCHDLAIGYPQHVVAQGINLDVEHGQRIAVVGDNGQGKTTFLRTLSESLPRKQGEVRWGHGCDVGVYAQHVYQSLPQNQTILDYLLYVKDPTVKEQTAVDVAGSFLFTGELVQKPIRVLSGGERARVCLAGLLLGGHNILVMDEPGNHLDVETVEALAAAMVDFEGTLIFTSHDRYFMRRVATGVIEVRDGRVVSYPGSYDDYVYRITKEVERGQAEQAPPAADGEKTPSRNQSSDAQMPVRRDDQKAAARRRFELQKEASSLERQIARQEDRRRELEAQLLAATTAEDVQRIQLLQQDTQEKLTPLESRWLELLEELEEEH